MKEKIIAILAIAILFSSCTAWTSPSQDATACKPGKSLEAAFDDLVIALDSDNEVEIWTSYNGEDCGDIEGLVPSGQEVMWSQIVVNASNQFLVNVSSNGLSGWVYCSDLVFTGDMERYLGILDDEGFDLYLDCVNASKR